MAALEILYIIDVEPVVLPQYDHNEKYIVCIIDVINVEMKIKKKR